MPDQIVVTMNSAFIQATAAQARNANSVLHLWKFGSLNPNVTTPLTDFTEAECDFDGYAALTIATWVVPFLAGQAWGTAAPRQYFRWEHVLDDVGNDVGGWYLVTAGGQLLDFGVFDPPQGAAGVGQVVPVEPTEIFVAG